MEPAIPDQATGKFQESEVVLCLLVVAYQDRPALAQPRQRALHYPPARWIPLLLVLIQLLLTDSSDMRPVLVISNSLPPSRIVVPLVQAQILRRFRRRPGTLDHYRLERRRQQFRVMGVGSTHHNR